MPKNNQSLKVCKPKLASRIIKLATSFELKSDRTYATLVSHTQHKKLRLGLNY